METSTIEARTPGRRPADTRRPPRVVVGVDGSDGSLAALRIAIEEARLRGVPLQVVTAWQLTWSEIALETPALVKKVEDDAARRLDAALSDAGPGTAAGVEISGELVNGHAATVLTEAARDASVLVVGAGRAAGVAGTLLGSVTRAVIHHAPCPVLVVPAGPSALG